MALITETNQQYYQGAQGFRGAFLADGVTLQSAFVTTFDTSLVFGSANAWDPNDANYALNNFKIYTRSH